MYLEISSILSLYNWLSLNLVTASYSYSPCWAFVVDLIFHSIISKFKLLDILKRYDLPYGALPNNFQSVKPLKLGMSVDNIKKRNDILIEDFVNYSNIWLKKGCTILGGCCEITPDYINGLNQFLMKNKYNKVNFFN